MILAVALTALACGESARAGFPVRSVSENNLNYLHLADLAAYYGMEYAARDGVAELSWKHIRVGVAARDRDCRLAGVRVLLGYAPIEQGGEVHLSEPDFRLVLDPVLRSHALPRVPVRRVLLDPGHGGDDPGAQGAILTEKTLLLQLARALALELRKHGYEVAMTRDGDHDLSLKRRVTMTRKWKADVFVSLHANAADAASVQGAETFVDTPVDWASTHGGPRKTAATDNNAFDRQNMALAFDIQRRMVLATGAVDRGVRRARYAVLETSACPAVLVEVGFLSSPREEKLLASRIYQARLVAGILAGIRDYTARVAPPVQENE
jgi:N-acetylmuramoyl-L-alanine amidase